MKNLWIKFKKYILWFFAGTAVFAAGVVAPSIPMPVPELVIAAEPTEVKEFTSDVRNTGGFLHTKDRVYTQNQVNAHDFKNKDLRMKPVTIFMDDYEIYMEFEYDNLFLQDDGTYITVREKCCTNNVYPIDVHRYCMTINPKSVCDQEVTDFFQSYYTSYYQTKQEKLEEMKQPTPRDFNIADIEFDFDAVMNIDVINAFE